MVVWYVALMVKPSNSSNEIGIYDDIALSFLILPLKLPNVLNIYDKMTIYVMLIR
jgi:hypothetical protein